MDTWNIPLTRSSSTAWNKQDVVLGRGARDWGFTPSCMSQESAISEIGDSGSALNLEKRSLSDVGNLSLPHKTGPLDCC